MWKSHKTRVRIYYAHTDDEYMRYDYKYTDNCSTARQIEREHYLFLLRSPFFVCGFLHLHLTLLLLNGKTFFGFERKLSSSLLGILILVIAHCPTYNNNSFLHSNFLFKSGRRYPQPIRPSVLHFFLPHFSPPPLVLTADEHVAIVI